jgi:hypothetical protein
MLADPHHGVLVLVKCGSSGKLCSGKEAARTHFIAMPIVNASQKELQEAVKTETKYLLGF